MRIYYIPFAYKNRRTSVLLLFYVLIQLSLFEHIEQTVKPAVKDDDDDFDGLVGIYKPCVEGDCRLVVYGANLFFVFLRARIAYV